MGDFHAAGTKRSRHFNQGPNMVDVRTMNDGIDGERQLKLMDQIGERKFSLMRTRITRNVVRGRCLHVLQRKLDMIEPGVLQPAQPRTIQPNRGSYEIGIKPGIARKCDDFNQDPGVKPVRRPDRCT